MKNIKITIPKDSIFLIKNNQKEIKYTCVLSNDCVYECYDSNHNKAIITSRINKKEIMFRVSELNGVTYKPWPENISFWEPGDCEEKFEKMAYLIINDVEEYGEGYEPRLEYKIKNKTASHV